MPEVEIICLAKSRKPGGCCVAGLRTDGGGWLRPVTDTETGTLSGDHCEYRDRTEARVLDRIRVDVTAPAPRTHHPEDWLIGRLPWWLVERPADKQYHELLQRHVVRGPALLGSRAPRLLPGELGGLPHVASLALVRPDTFQWSITPDVGRKLRGVFTLDGQSYDFSVTDPRWERKARELPPGLHEPAAAGVPAGATILLTISLSDLFKEAYWKLIAAVVVV